jgi:hypothetical protein
MEEYTAGPEQQKYPGTSICSIFKAGEARKAKAKLDLKHYTQGARRF